MSEIQHHALLPLQKIMRILTSGQGCAHFDKIEDEMQMAAMRILANVSWVLEISERACLQQGPTPVSTKNIDSASCKT